MVRIAVKINRSGGWLWSQRQFTLLAAAFEVLKWRY